MRRYRQAKGSDSGSLERDEKDRVPLRAPSSNPDGIWFRNPSLPQRG